MAVTAPEAASAALFHKPKIILWFGDQSRLTSGERFIYQTQVLDLVISKVAPAVKNPPVNAGDIRGSGWIPGLET